jgi:hypothetical protein
LHKCQRYIKRAKSKSLASSVKGSHTDTSGNQTATMECQARKSQEMPGRRDPHCFVHWARVDQWEPYESRGSRTVAGEPEGEVPSGYSTGEGWLNTSPYPIMSFMRQINLTH